MKKAPIHSRRMRVILLLCAFLGSPAVRAAQLKQATEEAFERYVRVSEAGGDIALNPGTPFLWVDRQDESGRSAMLARLRAGEIVMEKVETLDGGKRIGIPGGMVHHWIGTVFIPGATLDETLAFEEDYNNNEKEFQPEVVRSKILEHKGADFLVLLRFRKHKIVTVVLDTEHKVHYDRLDPARARSFSFTTRIQQVKNPGAPGEYLLPAGDDEGFLWRMNTYWRFEEKDGGVYVECQTISLTRNIPAGLGWLIGPFVTSVPRESIDFSLSTTRRLLLRKA